MSLLNSHIILEDELHGRSNKNLSASIKKLEYTLTEDYK